MPIGGGTFTVQNKILPGAYINFVSMGTNAKMGSRGVAALPLELNWGPDDKVFTMTATDFNATSLKVFGYDPTDANILLVREALKRAKSLLIYRVNGGNSYGRNCNRLDRWNERHCQRRKAHGRPKRLRSRILQCDRLSWHEYRRQGPLWRLCEASS